MERCNKFNSYREQKFYYACLIRARGYQCIKRLPKLRIFGGSIRHSRYGEKEVISIKEGRKILSQAIKENKPFMAARFGTNEGRALFWYWQTKVDKFKKNKNFPNRISDELCICAGFFPNQEKMMRKWAELETEACKELDVLGTMDFFSEEWIVSKLCSQAILMPASGITPDATGWTKCLEGKKVLVIHPFAKTIEEQYFNHREEIYPGKDTLPVFDLQCIKAVQTIADEKDERFADWFEALDYMTEEVAKKDFDVALIGCGAYGFQLASRIKKMGKVAIHMGGSLQTLFGIRGSRWDNHPKVGKNYNNAWVYPSEEETPKGFEKVEGGCYWK